jgi:choline/ethanolamine kinase
MEAVESILAVVHSIETSWAKVVPENCKVTRLVSNSSRVFLVETSLQVLPKRFIFRVFGSSDTLNLTVASQIVQKLCKYKLAPTVFAETSTYRLEEFLEGFRNLTRTEIVQERIACKISKKLRDLHSLDLSDILDRDSVVCTVNALKWRKFAQSVFHEPSRFSRNEALQVSECLSERYLMMFNDVLPKESPIVLAHMDTSFLNILYQEVKDEVYILDFDYTGYCYRGFDIAMLLTDVKYDYNHPVYPFYQYQQEAYPGDQILASCVQAYGEGVEMFVECKRCMIASNYLWAMWAFSLYSEDSDGIDMLSYGLLRFSEFIEGYEDFKNKGLEGMRREALPYFA